VNRASAILGHLASRSHSFAAIRFELVETWDVTTSEALAVKRLVDEWLDSPNNGRGNAEREADLRRRVDALLRGLRAMVDLEQTAVAS
jgi:hypothetical protein